MRKSKLIKTLQLFTDKEFKQFRYFLQSPYFNRNKNCLALYELLLPFAPSFDSPKLDEPNFTKNIYSNKRSMYTLSNELVRLVESFLIEEELKRRPRVQKFLLLEKFKSRGAPKLFERVYQSERNCLLEKKGHLEDYHKIYLLEMSNLEMLFYYSKDKERVAKQLSETIRAFGNYSYSGHLMMDNIVYNMLRSGVTKKMATKLEAFIPNSETFINIVKQEVENGNEIFIQLHLLLRKMNISQKEDDFMLFFEIFKANHSKISKENKDFFYRIIVNFCHQRIMEGSTNYYHQALEVYLFAIDSNAFTENLEPIRLKNIIVVSVKSGQINLAHDLLKKYIPLIHSNFQKVTAFYCKGYLYYFEKKFDLAVDSLNECINLRSLFELDAQTILYKVYYEKEEDWAFNIPVQSFIIRLSRQSSKHPKGVIEGYLNFFRILKQIYRKKRDPNYKKTKESLLERINSMKYISDKRWLLQKVERLKY